MINKVEMVESYPAQKVLKIRVNTYLESGEVGYEEHHVQVDGVWQNNPCLNTFIKVPDFVTAKQLQGLMTAFLNVIKNAPDKHSSLVLRGLIEHLLNNGLDRTEVRLPRIMAVVTDHPLLGLEVKQ